MAEDATPDWRRRQETRRRRQRERLALRVQAPVPAALKGHDPLQRGGGSALRGVGMLGAAVLLHVAVLGGFLAASALLGEEVQAEVAAPLQVVVHEVPPPAPPAPPVVEPPPAPPEVEAPEPPAPVVEAPKPPPKPKRVKPRRRVKRSAPREVAKEAAPPADPTADAPPPPKEAAPQPRRIVGLNMESTVTGGGGPSFAVGNTRMGATAATADDPRGVKALAPGTPGRPGGASGADGTGNRVAAVIPGRGVKLEKPRRIGRVKPAYPELLKARNVEGDVKVMVSLDAAGRVTGVTLVAPSKHGAFNASALAAARRERFKPATRDGEGIAYRLSYTYRFRLNDR